MRVVVSSYASFIYFYLQLCTHSSSFVLFTAQMPIRFMPRPRGAFWNSAIRPSVCPMAQLPGLWARWPPEMCGLRTRPLTGVDPLRFCHLSNCHRRGAYRLAAPGAIPCCICYSYLIIRFSRVLGFCVFLILPAFSGYNTLLN